MPVQRLTLAQIETEIIQAVGVASSLVADWQSSANLYIRINEYMQRLPMRIAGVAMQLRGEGKLLPYSGIPRFDMWRTRTGLTATSGSRTVYFPEDYDHYLSFYDATNDKPIYVIEDVDTYHPNLRNKPPGPPEAIEIHGYINNLGTWVRYARLYPQTATGVTPSINCAYWRIPASVTLSTEFLDIDPKYERVVVFGVIADLVRKNSQEFDRYAAEEQRILTEMAMTARGS